MGNASEGTFEPSSLGTSEKAETLEPKGKG